VSRKSPIDSQTSGAREQNREPSRDAVGPLNNSDFTATVSAITSAFGDPTRRAIYLFTRESKDGVTASEVSEKFELHANVARHHLDKLAAGGYLEVQIARQDGRTAGVIDVRVGQPNLLEFQSPLLDLRQDQVEVTTWIDHCCLLGLIVPNQRAVLLKRRDRDGLVLKHAGISMGFACKAM
jgi:DNA-binding transcriptional ArsR family regulator